MRTWVSSLAKSTLDISNPPPWTRPAPPIPAGKKRGEPELPETLNRLSPTRSKPSGLVNMAMAICATGRVTPLVKLAIMTPRASTEKLSKSPGGKPSWKVAPTVVSDASWRMLEKSTVMV